MIPPPKTDYDAAMLELAAVHTECRQDAGFEIDMAEKDAARVAHCLGVLTAEHAMPDPHDVRTGKILPADSMAWPTELTQEQIAAREAQKAEAM